MGTGTEEKVTYVQMVRKGQSGTLTVLRLDDKAATREAIIKAVRAKGHTFTERSSWGARSPKRPLEDDWNYHAIAIHHQGNGPEHVCTDMSHSIKDVEAEHMDKKGFDAVGYHYVIDCNGGVAEGRDIRYKGSHISNNNTQKIGILLLGDLTEPGEEGILYNLVRTNQEKVPEPQNQALIHLILAIKKHFAIIKLGGHREFAVEKGDQRYCPGNVGMRVVTDIRGVLGLSKP